MFVVKTLLYAVLILTAFTHPIARPSEVKGHNNAPTKILDQKLQTIPLPLPDYYTPYTLQLGSPEAPIVIHKFFSFACPSCLAFHHRFFSDIEKKYINTGKVRWVYVPYALDLDTLTILILLPHIPNNKQHAIFSKLMESAPSWNAGDNKQAIFNLLQSCGITQEELSTIYKTFKKDTLSAAFKLQQHIIIDGTPTFFLNGKELPGIPNANDFARYIEQQLKEQ